jgi:EPS-associated MarR family transcriptional regulator
LISDEYRYKLLRLLSVNPKISQRELARELGISLGKTNYCLTAMIEKGLLKAQSFKNNRNKRAYIYLLTPGGIEEKALVTLRFLGRKMAEYEALQHEIERLRHEAATELERVDNGSRYTLLDDAKIGERT